MPPHRLLPLLPVVLLAAAGCHDEKISSYQVPKEKDPELPGMTAPSAGQDTTSANSGGSAMSGTVPIAAGPTLSWTAPADWQIQAPGAMRKASFAITGPEGRGELSVTAFPGDVGGELANVNRWRGQVGLPPLTAANLDQNVDRQEIHGLPFTIVDLGDRQSPNRILGALVPFGGGVWFFKLTGPGALLERLRPQFLQFLQSVKPPA